ncbi:hypothetical protein AcW2_005448 [Taiwanofungus camphoratus]|nr:hypothetical protein AcW2_005448 [Antrodia cinnamomea]
MRLHTEDIPQSMRSVTHHPFTKPTADVILVLSDDVEFRVHKAILAEASSFFEAMFSLPQPSVAQISDGTNINTVQHLPVVRVTEHSVVLHNLLRLCYPIRDPTLNELSEVQPVLEAAIKYDIEEAIELMKGRLIGSVPNAPLRVYAIACRHKLEDIALAAAKEVLSQSLQSKYVPEMDGTTAGEYCRPLRYCGTGGKFRSRFSFCHTGGMNQTVDTGPVACSAMDAPYPFNLPDADVVLRTSDGVDFRVHRNILSLASSVLDRLVSQEMPSAVRTDMSGREDPVVALPEDSSILSVLLRLCYPMENLPRPNRNISSLLAASRKYEMKKAVEFLESELMSLTAVDPLKVYLIACRFGLQEHADEAARRTLGQPVHKRYRPEMEDVSAAVFYHLLQYRQNCNDVALRLTHDYDRIYAKVKDLFAHCRTRGQWPCWFTTYMDNVRIDVMDNPSGAAVLSGNALDTTFSSVASRTSRASSSPCNSCQGMNVATSLLKTSRILADELDGAICGVLLEWQSSVL